MCFYQFVEVEQVLVRLELIENDVENGVLDQIDLVLELLADFLLYLDRHRSTRREIIIE